MEDDCDDFNAAIHSDEVLQTCLPLVTVVSSWLHLMSIQRFYSINSPLMVIQMDWKEAVVSMVRTMTWIMT